MCLSPHMYFIKEISSFGPEYTVHLGYNNCYEQVLCASYRFIQKPIQVLCTGIVDSIGSNRNREDIVVTGVLRIVITGFVMTLQNDWYKDEMG